VIKRRMYNYRKHGTNEPTVTLAYKYLLQHCCLSCENS